MSIDYHHCASIIGNVIEKNKHSFFIRRKKNQRFNLRSAQQLCYLVSGEVSIFRISNNSLSVTLKAPAVLGLAQLKLSYECYYMRCASDTEMWLLNHDVALEEFDRNCLWKFAFDIITYHLHIYYEREELTILPNVKLKVLEYIKQLWTNEDSDNKLSIYKHINSKTNISRSAIYKAIKELERNGYITTCRGKLVNINTSLITPK